MDKHLLQKKLYIFDMGGVVIKGIQVVPHLGALLGIDQSLLEADYRHYDFPLMEGTVGMDEYYRHLQRQFGVDIPGDPMADYFKPHQNEVMARVIRSLRLRNSGARIVCGSNTYAAHWAIIQRNGWDSLFDRCYLSHLMHLTKPFPMFYQYILKEEGVKAEDTCFIDDYQENILGAESVGIAGLLYDSDEKLEATFGF